MTHRTSRAVAALAASLLAVAQFTPSPALAAMQRADAVMEALRGCWSSAPVADGRGRSDTYCFDPAGYLSGASIAYGDGGDFCVRWTTDGPRTLLLYFGPEPDACDVSAGSDGRSFDLSGCREAGHFRRDPQFDLSSWPCDATTLD